MQAKSIKGNSTTEVESALQDLLKDNFRPTLAIVFISVKQDRQALCDLLRKEKIDVFGATSCGEFINGHQSEGEIVILLLNPSRNNYTILLQDTASKNLEEASAQIAKEALNVFKNPTFFF